LTVVEPESPVVSDGGELAAIDPDLITANPNNPRRYFNEERLDLLRTSIQEVGILVPLIVYRSPGESDAYVLMDGERRWRCALDLGLEVVPVNVISAPDPLENLLRMFNIHNVREDWALVSVALSMKEVITISGEDRESRLSEMTGLTRSTVRRAKRLLSIPESELELIRNEAHLDRSKQVHREDLYLEIEAAESVVRSELPDIGRRFSRPEIIRAFATKAEVGSLRAITDFRLVSKLIKAIDDDVLGPEIATAAVTRLIEQPEVGPKDVFDSFAAEGFRQQSLQRKVTLLSRELVEALSDEVVVSAALKSDLEELLDVVRNLLEGRS
jgi:ParB family chromosome partitioning protein